MTKMPKISIITPSYNQGQFIERTIQSVIAQKYPQLEFIIMDGGSTDNTVSILRKYEKLLLRSKSSKNEISFIWRSKPDGGQTNAINIGLKLASGDILAYLNSDDTYEPGALKTVATYFLSHPKEYFVYGKGKLIDINDHDIGMYNDFQVNTKRLHQSCGVSQPTAFWRRQVLEKVGFFDETFQFTMDYDYWIRVSKKYKMTYLPVVLANTRIHAMAKTSQHTQKLYNDAIRVQKKHFSDVHPNWIFMYANDLVQQMKSRSLVNKVVYWAAFFSTAFWLQLWWNHKLPKKEMWSQYFMWIDGMFQNFTHKLK